MRLRRTLYRHQILKSASLPGKVISVGNLEVGGTGKSPVVIAIAESIVRKGEKPIILTRGYKSGMAPDESAVLLNHDVILPPQKTKKFFADEARMQSARLKEVPIVIGANRKSAADRFLREYPAYKPSIWILDDGFQHLKIKRDVDIVLLDESLPFANHRTLPAGRLRESPERIYEADLVLFTRACLEQPATALQRKLEQRQIPCFRVEFTLGTPYSATTSYRDKIPSRDAPVKWGLVTAIAQPHRLAETLRDMGWNLHETLFKRDHQNFRDQEFFTFCDRCDAVLTTEKDYFRDKEIFTKTSKNIFIIPLKLEFDGDFLSKF